MGCGGAGGSISSGAAMFDMEYAFVNLEGFVGQAVNLREQTLHQLCRLLSFRQAARCFVVSGEYYGRLSALSSLWAPRPRG